MTPRLRSEKGLCEGNLGDGDGGPEAVRGGLCGGVVVSVWWCCDIDAVW